MTATVIELTPTQIRGLKLAKDGDLYFQAPKNWTHENPVVTYAKTDRFKERPQKIKFVTNTTLEELKSFGFLERMNLSENIQEDAHTITMAGKIWLLRNK